MEIEAQNAIYLGEETGGRGRQFRARFLVPGLVKYDYGVCLLTKENADKFIQGFTGCPVVINHQNVTDDNVKDIAVGDIFSVWFDNNDGYYWCNGIIRDKEAIKLINEGYSVSCQYLITEYSDNTKGALHNGNPYDKVIENGKPEHLAIVNNPRYEGAIIAVNAILAQNEDKWITIHPNGEENKGRHLLLKDGESVEDAMHRNGWYAKRQAKEDKKEEKKQSDTKEKKHYQDTIDRLDEKYGVDKNDKGESWYDRASVSEIKTDIKTLEHEIEKNEKEIKRLKDLPDDIASKIDGGRDKKIKGLQEQITRDKEHIEYANAHIEKKESGKESKKQDKSDDSAEKKYTWNDKEYSLKDLVNKGFIPTGYTTSIDGSKPQQYLYKTEGKKEYRLPVSDDDLKKIKEYQKEKEADDLKKAKEKSKDLTDYIKWQYSQDIEPHITRRVGDRTLVRWDDLPKETQSALKRLDFDNKINLEQYSGSEMSISVKDKKIFDNLKKHQESKKDDNIPKAYSRSEKTKLLYKYKTGKISREEWVKETEKLNASNSFIEQFKDTLYTVLAAEIFDRLGE